MKKILIVVCAVLLLPALFSCGQESGDAFSAFRFHGTEIAADAEVAPILQALGTPALYQESGSCANPEEKDKLYGYDGFQIRTVSVDGKDRVRQIVLTDDSVSTAEGIAVGSGTGAVTAAYGDADQSSGGILTYVGKNCKLVITTRDGTVTGISYLYAQ